MFVQDKRNGTEQCEFTEEAGQTDRYIKDTLQMETQIDGITTTLITKPISIVTRLFRVYSRISLQSHYKDGDDFLFKKII